MAKLNEMVAAYAQDLREVCGIVPDMILLEWVVRIIGPQALAAKSAQFSATDDAALNKAVRAFIARQGLSAALTHDMVLAVKDSYPSTQRYRAVVVYLVAQNFGLRDSLVRA